MNSKDIKRVLKENGIDTKNLKVRCGVCGYSERVEITIKDITINKKDVERIVKQFESIDYDERTGEILQGGNTYVFVQYDYTTVEEANEKYNNDVLNIINKELNNMTSLERENWNKGEINPIITLSEKIICYRDGSRVEIRDLKDYTTRMTTLDYMARTLIEMGLLNKVLGGLK